MSIQNELIFTITVKIKDVARETGDEAVEALIARLQELGAQGMDVTIQDLRPSFTATPEGTELVPKQSEEPEAYEDIGEMFED